MTPSDPKDTQKEAERAADVAALLESLRANPDTAEAVLTVAWDRGFERANPAPPAASPDEGGAGERARQLLVRERLSVKHNVGWLTEALIAERRRALAEAEKMREALRLIGIAAETERGALQKDGILKLVRSALAKEG